jgi:hypothetical protein
MTKAKTKNRKNLPAGQKKTSAPSYHSWKDVCTHNKATKVLTIEREGENTEIYAGSHNHIAKTFYRYDWLICLNGNPIRNPITFSQEAKDRICSKEYPKLSRESPPRMSIDWPDYGIPDVGKVIWDEIYQLIQHTPGKIAVYCEGGHGRTGTFLSIIAHRLGYREPVKHIRQVYCRKAVESLAQINYIKSFGITVKESPAVDYGNYNKDWSYSTTGATTYKKNGEKLPCNHYSCPVDRCAQPDKDSEYDNDYVNNDTGCCTHGRPGEVWCKDCDGPYKQENEQMVHIEDIKLIADEQWEKVEIYYGDDENDQIPEDDINFRAKGKEK